MGSSIVLVATLGAVLLSPVAQVGHADTSAKANAVAGPSQSKPNTYTPRASTRALKWADEQLRKMSVDEKIGQLI